MLGNGHLLLCGNFGEAVHVLDKGEEGAQGQSENRHLYILECYCATWELFDNLHGDCDKLARHYTHTVFVTLTLTSMGYS